MKVIVINNIAEYYKKWVVERSYTVDGKNKTNLPRLYTQTRTGFYSSGVRGETIIRVILNLK